MPYDCLLLDLDGTVLDYQTAQRTAFVETLALAGLDERDDAPQVYARINHELWLAYERGEITPAELRTRRWELVVEEMGVDADPNELSTTYLDAFVEASTAIDDAVAVVASLAERHRLAVVTNGFGDVQRRRLARTGLSAHLPLVVVSDEVGVAKPAAAVFDAAFALLDQPDRSTVAIVGDSLTSDMAGGHAYGIDTIHVDPDPCSHDDHPSPTRCIRHVRELLV